VVSSETDQRYFKTRNQECEQAKLVLEKEAPREEMTTEDQGKPHGTGTRRGILRRMSMLAGSVAKVQRLGRSVR